MKQSDFLRWNWRDALHAFIIAFIAFVADYLQTTFIPQLDIPLPVKMMAVYLIKKLLEPSDVQIMAIGGGGIKNPPKP